jgi:hypothetical protein
MSKKKTGAEASRLSGKLISFNVDPRGEIEGAMIDTSGGLAQVNFPKHLAPALAKSMRVGARIEIGVTPEKSEADHSLFRATDDATVTGTIKRLNFTLHGEVNGYHLSDSTFVHVKPEGARKHRLVVGDRITATGPMRAGLDARVLECKRVARLNVRKGERIGMGTRSYEQAR